MDRAIRRKDRAISEEEARNLLEKGEYGILSTVGKEGRPYGIPLSYVMMDGALYFHCALMGRKVENLEFCPQVSFCVVGPTRPVYAGSFSTYYECALAQGTARKVEDAEEKRRSLMLLAEKYLSEHMDKAPGDIEKSFKRTAVYAIDIERLTGKAKRPSA